MFGVESGPWEGVGQITTRLRSSGGIEGVSLFFQPFGTTYTFPDRVYRLISDYRDRLHSSQRPAAPLFRLLYNFRDLDCTDPRDRRYAFLVLAAEATDIEVLAAEATNIEVLPDYAAAVSAAYRDFALQAIHKTGTLDVPNCCRHAWDDADAVEGPAIGKEKR